MAAKKRKRISLKFIAGLAGCSTTTVSNVINKKGLFGDEIRDKILKIVKKYGYTINPSARSLRMGKSETVALVFYRPNVDIFKSEYYLTMTYGFQKRLSELGFEILLSEISQEDVDNNSQPRFVARGKADAIVVLGRIPERIVASLRRCGLPMLMLDSYFKNIDSIYTDGLRATEKLTSHLAALGHKKIAYLAYDNFDFNTAMRINGYLKAMKAAGLGAKVYRNFKTNEEGCAVLGEILSKGGRPTAVLACNDVVATSLMCHAQSMGFRVPEDISFCGYDDTVIATRCTPKLTTVHVDCEHIGSVGAETIAKRMESPSRRPYTNVFPAEIIARGSTGAAPRVKK